MDIRTESAISVCIMYALLIAACICIVALGPALEPYTRESWLELPIFIQLVIAEAIGLTPFLQWLATATHWTLPYLAVIASSFFALYWLGWWIGAINDERGWADSGMIIIPTNVLKSPPETNAVQHPAVLPPIIREVNC